MDVVMYLIFGVCCGIMVSIFIVIDLLEETEREVSDENSN